ncbi:MAG: HAMP domain-containing sensor histidine kinase [Clostridia bacterium]|nr:HAMP domain-containing sensor histidine kinase [Clostridia bacterium]
MRRTIFNQILTAQILVISLCVLILASLLFAFFASYMIDEKKTLLADELTHINALTVFYQDNPGEAMSAFYFRNLNDIAARSGGVIFLANPKGEMIAGSGNLSEHIKGKLPESYLPRLFAGQHISLGNLNGFFKETYLMVSRPLDYRGEVPAVSCIAVPMPAINRYRGDILHTVIIAVLLTASVSFVMSYFIALRISKPLKQISAAAQGIAKGNFDVEVPVHGNSEVALLSETFNQMTYSLRKLEDMRSGFIANVSHELRTPMTTISGFIEGILDNTIPPERQKDYLTIVLHETKRLARLVNELLLVARLEGGLEMKMSVFDMNELVRIAILRFENVFSEKNIQVDIHFAEDTCLVKADKDAIDRVLINLFDNASKFNRQNGYVRVSVDTVDGLASITVENSGDGISAEDLNMIWDKFYKTDKSRSQDKTGVGLGLYLVKNIIAAHGGKIKAESKEGEYTRFVFTLEKASK